VFLFGHLGLGRALVRPWHSRLPWVPLAVGMLVPDLIDKPLYYLSVSPFFSCTRTVGHTAVFAATVLGLAALRRSPRGWALGVGVATHLLLDNVFDAAVGGELGSAWIALVWPLDGWDFYRVTFTLTEHAGKLVSLPTIGCEIVGLGLLEWERRRRVAAPETAA
jgi:hypothetical protein